MMRLCASVLILMAWDAVCCEALRAAPPQLNAQQQARIEEATKLNARVLKLHEQGQTADALPLAQQALAIRRELLGPKHPHTAASLNTLGALLEGMGDFAGARPCYEQALAIRREVLGPKHLHTSASLSNLGLLLESQGDYTAARRHLDQALAIYKEVLGPKHLYTGISLNNLGVLFESQGDYAAARRYHDQALAIRKQVLGPKHPDTASSLSNLGVVLAAQGDYAGARTYYEQALAIRKEVLGPKHRDTALALSNLGLLLTTQGDYTRARLFLEQALAIRKEVLGPKHPDTATSLNNLGALRHLMGDYTGAGQYYNQALAIRKEVLGPRHPNTATSLNNVGVLLEAQGDYAGARPYYEQALASKKEVLGLKHADTALALNNLGCLLQLQDDYAGARPHYEQALAIRKEVLGPKHRDTAASLNDLGSLLQAQGNYGEATPYYTQALAILKEVLGPIHPDTAWTLHNFARLKAEEGSWELATQLKDEARRGVRRHMVRVLPSLSAREQARFLSQKDEGWFHQALSLGWTRRDDAPLAELSWGWLLNGKAVAQEALAQEALLARDTQISTVGAAVQQLLQARKQLAALALSLPKPGQEAARREQFDNLQRQEEVLSRQIAEAHGQRYQADPWIEVAAVRQALPGDAVLIDIARFKVFDFAARGKQEEWQPARYAAWVIPPAGQGTVAIVDLGAAGQIDAALQLSRNALETAAGTIAQQGEPEAETLLQAPLTELARLVFQPLIKEIGPARQLIFSPDAALWLLPWGALPLEDGRYALEEYNIRYVVSGRDLVAQRQTAVQSLYAVMMADPNYNLSPAETEAATRAVLKGAAPTRSAPPRPVDPTTSSSVLKPVRRLPGTAVEAKAITPSLQAFTKHAPFVYTDQYALESVLKTVKSPKLLVLSTHGFFLPDQEVQPQARQLASSDTRSAALTVEGKRVENPLLRCGLLLAGCNQSAQAQATGGEDGILTGMEIVGSDLRGTELVVLSACETGLGQVRNGEGVAGLRQAFQLAGAEAVVSTLWQISDKDSARLMSDFFGNLAAGQSKADALRAAQLAMIKDRRARYSAAHPFFWAAFTLTGSAN